MIGNGGGAFGFGRLMTRFAVALIGRGANARVASVIRMADGGSQFSDLYNAERSV